jgi:hypothetical protein
MKRNNRPSRPLFLNKKLAMHIPKKERYAELITRNPRQSQIESQWEPICLMARWATAFTKDLHDWQATPSLELPALL